MKPITLEGKIRKDTGSKNAKQLRNDGMIPCELYGGKENIHFSGPVLAFRDLIYTDKFRLVKLTVDGNTYDAFVKSVQFHPVTDRILHIDFQELQPGKIITTEIPIKLTGMAAGVRDGGSVIQKTRKLRVKTLPENLVEQFEVDITELEMGKSINISEVSFEGIEVLDLPATPIARIPVPRAAIVDEVEEVLEGEEGAEGAEGAEGGEGEKPAEGGEAKEGEKPAKEAAAE